MNILTYINTVITELVFASIIWRWKLKKVIVPYMLYSHSILLWQLCKRERICQGDVKSHKIDISLPPCGGF